MFGSHRRYIPLSHAIRAELPDTVQVAGGPYTTYFHQAIDKLSLDAICVGDGEKNLPRFASTILMTRGAPIEGFHIRDGNEIRRYPVGALQGDLDSLPFQDRGLFYAQDSFLNNQEFKSFLSGRGCLFLCNYCFNHKFNEMYKGKGDIIRNKSVDYFIEEIDRTRHGYGMDYIPETKLKMEKLQKVFALVVRRPSLKRHLSLFYRMPSWLLYYVSLLTKIFIVIGYLPPVRWNPVQRMRVFFRFFSYYG